MALHYHSAATLPLCPLVHTSGKRHRVTWIYYFWHSCTHAGGLIDACTQAASGVLTPGQARLVLNQQLEYVVCILVIGGIASGFRAYLFNAAAERVMCRLRVQLFSKVCQRITAHVFVDLTTTNC